ncbi:MAG: hypothetical protein Phog2KO_07780 [Phototrophicaceae bacterium]
MNRLSLLSILTILALSIGLTSAQSDAIILQVAVSDFAEDSLQLAVEEFEAQNPTIQVQLVSYDGFGMPVNTNDDAETYQDDIATYFQLADVLLVNEGLTSEATRVGYALELTPLTQSDPNYNESAYYPTMIDAFKWDFGQWALPISSNFVTMTYTPSAFDEAGVSYPNESWTLSDLIFAADALTQYNTDGSVAIPGLFIQGGNNLDALLMSLLGQTVADDNAFPSVPNYADANLEALLEQWIDLGADTYTALPTGVDNDDVPMQIGNPQQGGGGGFAPQNAELTTATALLPGGSSSMTVLGYAVSEGTSYPMEAYELALFLTQDANAISVSGGLMPALINSPETEQANGGGQGGRGGNQTITAAFEPLVETAIMNGLTQADRRFSSGLGDALDLMVSDSLSASDALETVLDEQLARLLVADDRALTTVMAVNPPIIATTLGADEIALEFGVLAGGRGGGGVTDTWEALAEEFVAQDAQVGQLTIEQLAPNTDAIPETTQCYYSSSNLVSELDLSTVLSLDPLLFSDANYDPNNFVGGVLQQVQIDGATYAYPLNITPLVLTIDTASFEQVGVPIPDGTWTISEFEDALRQLSSIVDQDTAPFAVTGSTPLINLMAVYGGQPFDLSTDPVTVNFTDPATVVAIQQVLDLAQDGLISYAGGGFGGGGGNQSTSPITEDSLTGGFNNGGRGGNNNANTERVTVTFPIGLQGNAISLDLGTMYISSNSQNPDACYRFMAYVAQSADVFDSMPTNVSLLNSSTIVNTQGQDTVDYYLATADAMAQSDTLILPTNIDQFGFGMTQWLTAVFDAYLAGEVTDLDAELAIAQQRTQDYLACIDAIDTEFTQGNGQGIREEIEACVAIVNV